MSRITEGAVTMAGHCWPGRQPSAESDAASARGGSRGPTVAQVMVTQPKVLPANATVGAVRGMLEDDHVHLVLLVDGAVLRGTLSREDLPGCVRDDEPAMSWGRLKGRTIEPQALSDPVRLDMVRTRQRRLAVVDDQNTLLGLLCLKRLGHGYCSDDDVASRRGEARGGVSRP